MSLDNFSGEAKHEDERFGQLKALLGAEGVQTPELVAIFQQIKNLRECDRSLRSIRRNLELDNIPVIEPVVEEAEPAPSPGPQGELAELLDSFLSLKQEKEVLSDRLAQMVAVADRLEAKVDHLSRLVETRDLPSDRA